jgi:hypothetical protein
MAHPRAILINTSPIKSEARPPTSKAAAGLKYPYKDADFS